jgi:hemerythrin-like domain-containing protein
MAAGRPASASRARAQETGALEMLKEDHDLVKSIFKKYRALVEKGGSRKEKLALVKQACDALAVHAEIEEELFYPAMRNVVDTSTLAEAFVEHDCAKDLIQQLERLSDDEAVFDAKFIVLGEQVKHHIEEEESEIFPKARKSGIDLVDLGMEMQRLKDRLEQAPSFPARPILRESAPSYVQAG